MSTEPSPPIWQLAGVSPQAIALEDHRRRVSFGELEERTNAFGHGLEALGVQPGDHVALVAGNRVEFVEALLGAMRAGMLVTPVKTSWTAAEIEYVLRDAGSRALVTDVDAARAAAAAAGIPTIDLERGVGGESFERWLATQDTRPLPRDRKGWRLSYTSGTTGRPKGVHRLADGRLPWCEAFVASRSFAATAAPPHRRPAPERLGALPRRAARLRALAPRERLHDAHPAALGRGSRARRARPRRALDLHGADHVPPAARAAGRAPPAPSARPRCAPCCTAASRARSTSSSR